MVAMSRTRGGRKRCLPAINGFTSSHSISSAAVRRTSWPGSRTQAPSSASCWRRAKPCKATAKAGAGSRGFELQPQSLESACRANRDSRHEMPKVCRGCRA